MTPHTATALSGQPVSLSVNPTEVIDSASQLTNFHNFSLTWQGCSKHAVFLLSLSARAQVDSVLHQQELELE
jgi:hypothetical protein